MAITTKILPIEPCNEGPIKARIMSFPVSAAQAIEKGDVLYMIAGGTVTRSDGLTAAQINNVVGVAAEKKASIATVAVTDTVKVWPAIPGQVFEGHAVGTDATTDGGATTATGIAIIVIANHVTIPVTSYGDSVTRYAVASITTATLSNARVLGYADQQVQDTTNYKSGPLALGAGAVGIINPRVKFCFKTSHFTNTSLA